MANSRDFLRRDTLLAPRLSNDGQLRGIGTKLPGQMSHLDGGQPRFKSFVAALQPGAIDGLLERVTRQHTKNDGHSGVQLCELQSSRSLRADIIVMSGFAADHAT